MPFVLNRFGVAAIALVAAASTWAIGCVPMEPPQPPAATPPGGPEQAQPEYKTAEDLLAALEKADRNLHTLSAKIRYVKQFSKLEGGDVHIRSGTLNFANFPPVCTAPPGPAPGGQAPAAGNGGAPAGDPPKPADGAKQAPAPDWPRRAFNVTFTELIVDNERRTDTEVYIVSGDWFVEKHPAEKQMTKRRIAAPGERIDPLRLGQGPFPVPIGQDRKDVQSRFTAELVPALDGVEEAGKARFTQTYQVRLVPRPGTDEASTYREVRVWYRKSDLLPIRARTVNTDDGKDDVILLDPAVDANLPGDAFDVECVPGWDCKIEEFRRHADE